VAKQRLDFGDVSQRNRFFACLQNFQYAVSRYRESDACSGAIRASEGTPVHYEATGSLVFLDYQEQTSADPIIAVAHEYGAKSY
jgi:hypothetical protein